MEGDKPDAKQETRLEGMRRNWHPDQEWLDMVSQQTYETLRDQWMPELPPIHGTPAYLLPILFRVGPTLSTGMGVGSIDDFHLRAWQDNNVELQPWETDFLIRLSKEWLSEQSKACKHFAPPPWTPDSVEDV